LLAYSWGASVRLSATVKSSPLVRTITKRKFEFEKKFLDKGMFNPWFKARYCFLGKLGLNGYSLMAFLLGVAITLIALKLFSRP